MAKGKSSASSGTRKKHARRAAGAGPPGESPLPNEKKPKKEKGSKRSKEPRKKVYIPPVKPVPAQLDPLDTLGIAQRIPAELLVVLRKLAKKDSVTKRRALEDFHADWVEKSRRDETMLAVLEDVLPVWLHHLPALFTHPSRRVRQLAVSLHSSLLAQPSLAKAIISLLHEGTSSDHADFILGSWLLATCDIDRQVSNIAKPSWNAHVATKSSSSSSKLSLHRATFGPLWEFLQRVLLDPTGVYLQINPPQPILSISAPQSRKGSGKNTPVPRRVEEQPIRTKVEEEEESEADRKARLRISGFGALEWMLDAQSHLGQDEADLTSFLKPLDNAALWSALHHSQHAPFLDDDIEAFGWNQPGVRKACWGAVKALLRTHKGHLHGLEQSLSAATLRSAWVEPDGAVRSSMWQPLLILLKEHPIAWELEARGPPEADEAEDDSDSDDSDNDDAPKPPIQKPPTVQKGIMQSHAYTEFRQFLELGCMGSPAEAYPAILVVLSTIPPSILATVPTPVDTLFSSFWAAVDGRALSGLDRLAASAAFLSSLFECMIFVIRRLNSEQGKPLLVEGQEDGRQAARELVKEQTKRCWEEISSERLKLDQSDAASALTKTFTMLQQIDEELFNTAWSILCNAIKVQLITSQQGVPSLVPALLKGFRTLSPKQSKLEQANAQLINDVVHAAILRFEEILSQDESSTVDQARLVSLVAILNTFGDDIFADEGLASAIDTTCTKHAYRLVTLSPDVLLVYLSHRANDDLCARLWQGILVAIAGHEETALSTLEPLLRAAEGGQLPHTLAPSGEELDDVVGQLLVAGLSRKTGSSESLDLLRRVLANHSHFINTACLHGIAKSITATFAQHAQSCLQEEDQVAPALSGLLSLLQVITTEDILPLLQDDVNAILPDLFLFATVPSAIRSSSQLDAQYKLSRDTFLRCLKNLGEDTRQHVLADLQQRLHDIIFDCSIAIKPANLLHILSENTSGLDVALTDGVFPGQQELDKMLSNLPTYPTHVSIAVFDSLVLLGDQDDEDVDEQTVCDIFGYSSYARVVTSLLLYYLDNRDTAKENVWALRHFQALAFYAKDVLYAPSVKSAVFGKSVSEVDLQDLASKVDQLSAYLLTQSVDDGWFSRTIPLLSAGKAVPSSDGVAQLLDGMLHPRDGDNVRESRILHSILRHILSDVSKAEADQFLLLARSIEKKAPRASLTVLYSVTQYAPEPPRLDRLRNELAAGLMGVPPAKANSEGLWLLRRLAAVAPDPESDIVYLPTPRAVNLVKACQQWIASDEDLNEEVEYQMTTIFIHLAPILQTVPGAHWDLVFDVMENNLENCSFSDPATLPLLHRTLQLVLAVEELASTSKAFRATWQERRTPVFTLVRDMVVQKIDDASDAPLSLCRELALTVIQDLPETLVDRQSISQMCHLLMDSSDNVPKMSYKILQVSAAKYTEHLVLEASVESESTVPLELPPELVQLLQSSLEEDETPDSVHEQHMFGNMLAWMLTFDLFMNASLKVKIEYINHLRREGLIIDHFLPQIFTILRLYDGVARTFKLDIWTIDEYYLDLTSSDTPLRLPLLAAHLYYRALRIVPGLVRSWLADCRDRQLNTTVTGYTSTHFSPAIIRAELAQVKDPAVAADLADENLKIKVASNVHEVTASYSVDEYELELRLRLPADWPLHAVEVTDTARVGVTEDRWRSWVLGVQQILTFRGGSIVDGLAFFKKNVVSHFEGQSECAICYSMISAMDGTLPKKPCKTCKNKFHAGCLYKWFNSSHSSSCPLCRSEIIQ